MPGAGYTREFTYNEEAQLLVISHSGTQAYQYAYGADGNRRWSKDIANDLWTWYPCGVACGAGEMIEETSDLTGSSWSTSGQYLRAGGGCSSLLIRRKSSTDDEYHHVDMVGVCGVLTNAIGGLLQNNLSDAFAVPQYVDQNGQILSRQIATCIVTMLELDMQSEPNGGDITLQARALNITSSATIESHSCLKTKKIPPPPWPLNCKYKCKFGAYSPGNIFNPPWIFPHCRYWGCTLVSRRGNAKCPKHPTIDSPYTLGGCTPGLVSTF